MKNNNQANSSQCPPALTVLFDGACPLCRREIAVYRDLQPLQPGSTVSFADISNTAVPLPAGKTREQLLARFHVQSLDPAVKRLLIFSLKFLKANHEIHRSHYRRKWRYWQGSYSSTPQPRPASCNSRARR
jgi:hypothetical protein